MRLRIVSDAQQFTELRFLQLISSAIFHCYGQSRHRSRRGDSIPSLPKELSRKAGRGFGGRCHGHSDRGRCMYIDFDLNKPTDLLFPECSHQEKDGSGHYAHLDLGLFLTGSAWMDIIVQPLLTPVRCLTRRCWQMRRFSISNKIITSWASSTRLSRRFRPLLSWRGSLSRPM